MANLSDNKHVYNKTFSYKTISGGNMRVGDLVRHKDIPDIIGIIISFHSNAFFDVKVLWNGEINTCWTAVCNLEVLCE
mgnify:CR=1 FL=1